MKVIILWLFCVSRVDANSMAVNESPLDSKIIMGSPVMEGSVKYLVSLMKDSDLYCTGCLVSYKDVLTAGYCVYKTLEYQKSAKVNETVALINSKKYEILHANPHHGYYKSGRISSNNLGHIQLTSDSNLKVQEVLNTIAIPVADRFINIVGEICTVFAWGTMPSRLGMAVRKMQVRIGNDLFCDKHINSRFYKSFVAKKQMCGNPLKIGQRIQQEDYGSALVYDNILVGIVMYRQKVKGHIPPVTFMRLTDLTLHFQHMNLNVIPNNHSIYSIN